MVHTEEFLNRLTMRRIFLVLFLACVVDLGNSARKIVVNKCCPMDKHMSGNMTCWSERKDPWVLNKIFSARSGNFLPAGQVPKTWEIRDNQVPECAGNSRPKIVHYTHGSYLAFGNGSLLIVEYNKIIHPPKYCIDYNIALVCPEEIDQTKIKVKKCCGEGAVYSEQNRSCTNKEGRRIPLPEGYGFVYGFPQCNMHMAIAGKFVDAALEEDGGITVGDTKFQPETFCLEHLLENPDSASIFTCHVEPPPYTVEKHPGQRDLRFTLYPIGLALSAVFLAATLIAGSLLPASHHVLHWRCQTNHVACLLVGDVLLCIVQLSGGTLGKSPCFAIAVAMHFLFLSAFFWLNTMCFNIWWTFRDLRPQSLEKSQERWRLRIYELYAWGVPLLIAGTAAILDTVKDASYLIQPGFGNESCWFVGNKEILTYFFGPVGGLLVINIILFAATARELTCGLWKRELVKSTTERAALGRVCMKLVVVMGVTWIADVVSFAVGGPHEIWYITDLINCLQGVFIFIVVGLQPQVLTAVKRIWCLRKSRTAETAGTTNHHSSSSQGLPSMGDTITNNSITNGTTKSVPLETSC